MATLLGNGYHEADVIGTATRIITEHEGFIRAVIRFQIKDESREEDLFQEFFLSLLRTPPPADIGNIKSFIYRAITHDVVDALRRQKKYHAHLQKHAKETRISINNGTSRNAFIESGDRNSMFASLARHLRPREAEAVTLRYRDDRSIGEIAHRMGVGRRTVSRYLCEGLKRLRSVLAIE